MVPPKESGGTCRGPHRGGVCNRPGATRTSGSSQGLLAAFPGPCSPRGRTGRRRTVTGLLRPGAGFGNTAVAPPQPSVMAAVPSPPHSVLSGEACGGRLSGPPPQLLALPWRHQPAPARRREEIQPRPGRKGFLPHRKPGRTGVTKGVNYGTDPAVLTELSSCLSPTLGS